MLMDELNPSPSGSAGGLVRPGRLLAVVAGLLGLAAVAVAATVPLGGWSQGHARQGTPTPVLGHWQPATRFLLAVAVVIVATHALGAVVRRVGQPAVVGDILAGLLLGPSLLGAVSPGAWAWLFPPDVVSALEMAAQLGLVAFMLLLGAELRPVPLRRGGAFAATLSVANLGVPFACALPVAGLLYDRHAGASATPAAFSLFLALALSITALPVLGRILHDRGLTGTPAGSLALATALVSDVAAWVMLVVVLAVAGAVAGVAALVTLLLAAGFAVVMWRVVRPALAALARRAERGRLSPAALLAIVLAGALGASVVTEVIGVHAVFGAFLFGAVLPRDSEAVRRVGSRVHGITMAVLLPLFFASLGIQTSIGSIGASPAGWATVGGILAVAAAAKLLGVGLAARVAGLAPGGAWSVAVLMNCRGLTELVIADIGFRNGLIDQYLFTVLVVVALTTTVLTGPLLRVVDRRARRRSRPAGAAAATGSEGAT